MLRVHHGHVVRALIRHPHLGAVRRERDQPGPVTSRNPLHQLRLRGIGKIEDEELPAQLCRGNKRAAVGRHCEPHDDLAGVAARHIDDADVLTLGIVDRDLVCAQAGDVGVLAIGRDGETCGRGTSTSTSSGVIVLRLITAMRAGALTADIERVAYSRSLVGSIASSPGSPFPPWRRRGWIDRASRLRCHRRARRTSTIHPARRRCDAAWDAPRSPVSEIHRRNNGIGCRIDDGHFAGSLVRDVDENRGQQRQQEVHGPAASGVSSG